MRGGPRARLDCQLFVCSCRSPSEQIRFSDTNNRRVPGKLNSSVFFLLPSPLALSVAEVTAGPRAAPDSQVLFHGCPLSSFLSLCLAQLRSQLNSYANVGSQLIGVCIQMIYTFFAFFDVCIFTIINWRNVCKLGSINLSLSIVSLHFFNPNAFITKGSSHLADCFPAQANRTRCSMKKPHFVLNTPV